MRTGFTATWRAFFARLGLTHDRAKARRNWRSIPDRGGWFSRPPAGGVYTSAQAPKRTTLRKQSLVSTLQYTSGFEVSYGEMIMAFAIMRCAKLATMGSVTAALKHCFRERETPNADPARTPSNEHWAGGSVDDSMGRLRALLPEKRRKDAVLAVEYVMTASPDWWKTASQERQAQFFAQARTWLADKYGADRVIVATVHRDEATPHLSAFVVPLTQDGRLSAKEFIGNKAKMSNDQSTFAASVADLGLQRGIEGSRAQHQRVKTYYARVNEQTPKQPLLEAPAPSLADRLRPAEYGQRVVDSVIEQLQPTWSAMQAKAREMGVQARRANEARQAAENAAEARKRAEQRLQALESQFRPMIDLADLAPDHQAAMLADAAKRAADLRRKRDIEQERQRRIEALRKPRRRLAGAAATFAERAREAIEAAGGNADQVEWARVEADTIKEAMAQHGQSAADTAKAINEHSPNRADPASNERLSKAIQRAAPKLTAEYEQKHQHNQQQVRPEPGISR